MEKVRYCQILGVGMMSASREKKEEKEKRILFKASQA